MTDTAHPIVSEEIEPFAAMIIGRMWAPTTNERDYFTDENLDAATIMLSDLMRVEFALNEGRIIYVPTDGLGTGLSQLPQRAPKMYKALVDFFQNCSSPEEPCPWPTA